MPQRKFFAEQNFYIKNPEEKKKEAYFLSKEKLVSQLAQEAACRSAPFDKDLREWLL